MLTESWYQNFYLLPVPCTDSLSSLADALVNYIYLSASSFLQLVAYSRQCPEVSACEPRVKKEEVNKSKHSPLKLKTQKAIHTHTHT